MRDIATYESNLCEEHNLRSMFKMIREKIVRCKDKSQILNENHNRFQQFLENTRQKLMVIDQTKRSISLLVDEPDD